MPTATLVVSPLASRIRDAAVRASLVDDARVAIGRRGFDDLEVVESGDPATIAAATRTARDRGDRLVVIAGGDGTMRDASEALAASGIEVGILPCGTGNLYATAVGVPRALPAAVEALATGVATPFDHATVPVRRAARRPGRRWTAAQHGLRRRVRDRVRCPADRGDGPGAEAPLRDRRLLPRREPAAAAPPAAGDDARRRRGPHRARGRRRARRELRRGDPRDPPAAPPARRRRRPAPRVRPASGRDRGRRARDARADDRGDARLVGVRPLDAAGGSRGPGGDDARRPDPGGWRRLPAGLAGGARRAGRPADHQCAVG